jgi:hypothetical protein
LHSGPVTAGVLRSERSRFQLFGDTMNTASRMESTGKLGQIQVSQETADLIIAAGKDYWLRQRKDTVYAKGKGNVSSYWLRVNLDSSSTERTSESEVTVQGDNLPRSTAPTVPADNTIPHADVLHETGLHEKTNRLAHWNIDVLRRLLKQMMAQRVAAGAAMTASDMKFEAKVLKQRQTQATNPLDEVVDVITLPQFNARAAQKQVNALNIDLDDKMESELCDYVTTIAAMYRNNPFHNFEHASHVAMSVVKLLSRIVAPLDDSTLNESTGKRNETKLRTMHASSMHDHTYGITSDPLTQFACVFSALVHDVDHTGAPNSQLIVEGAPISQIYRNKSIAVQNSLDIAWHLLMDSSYQNLRSAIYTTADEMNRFRQLLVNCIMATDILDMDLATQRMARWNAAFHDPSTSNSALSHHQTHDSSINHRKATIVIEHLMHASDVVHTMQHWHIYREWNERLFAEMAKAYYAGRGTVDPSEYWYQGEMDFMDHTILPLASKLKQCGVFGVSSDEYLQYATKNRKEWEERGHHIVSEMSEKMKLEYGSGRKLQYK